MKRVIFYIFAILGSLFAPAVIAQAVNCNSARDTVSMKVIGNGFGANNDLIEWFGPSMPVASCTAHRKRVDSRSYQLSARAY